MSKRLLDIKKGWLAVVICLALGLNQILEREAATASIALVGGLFFYGVAAILNSVPGFEAMGMLYLVVGLLFFFGGPVVGQHG